MVRFSRILFFAGHVQGVHSALQRTVTIAENTGAFLNVVDVLDKLPKDLLRLLPSVGTDALYDVAAGELVQRLDGLVKSYNSRNGTISSELLIGATGSELISAVNRNTHDLVIIPAPTLGTLLERLFGGMAVQLMRKCSCPLWVMQTNNRRRQGGVMAAVNTGQRTTMAGLNRTILELASSIAKLESRHLHVFDLRGCGESASELEELLEQGNLRSVEYSVQQSGKAAQTIPGLVEKKDVELVVMANSERREMRVYNVNEAGEMLRKTNCSILAVKPDASPVPLRLRAA